MAGLFIPSHVTVEVASISLSFPFWEIVITSPATLVCCSGSGGTLGGSCAHVHVEKGCELTWPDGSTSTRLPSTAVSASRRARHVWCCSPWVLPPAARHRAHDGQLLLPEKPSQRELGEGLLLKSGKSWRRNVSSCVLSRAGAHGVFILGSTIKPCA